MTSPIHLMIVGAFPSPGSPVVGGIATSCRVLLQSTLPSRARLTLLDSSQASNPPPGLFVRALRAASRLLRFVIRFETARPQSVVLFSSPGASTIEKGVMAWYAHLRRRPSLLLPRGVPPQPRETMTRHRALRTLAFGGASCVVCQGEAWQRFAVGTLGLPADKAPIVPNWTATPELLAIGRERRHSDRAVPSLLYLGWVEREKGVLDLLSACEILKNELSFRLDIVGNGHAMGEVAAWIEDKGMSDRVVCHGWLHGDEKLEQLRRADIFVLPSWAEGLPNAMIEAMACRITCIVSDVGNIPSTIGDTGAATLVPSRNVNALADALRHTILNRHDRELVANAGYALAARHFDAESAVDRLLDIAQRSIAETSDARH